MGSAISFIFRVIIGRKALILGRLFDVAGYKILGVIKCLNT